MIMQNWNEYIFFDKPFAQKAMEVFEYQFEYNAVYRCFCEAMHYPSDRLKRSDGLEDIPLLPVQAFKDARITCQQNKEADLVFESSGTTGMQPARHHVADPLLYKKSLLNGFSYFYDLKNAVILGYTPGYSDNLHSSLIWMINELIAQDDIKKSRFLKIDKPLSQGEVDDIEASGKQLILFGAAFGLLDLIEISSVNLPSDSVVIETGGMKTHRREMNRPEIHKMMARAFSIDINRIHSEYGMCELLSQAYATGGKWFRSVPWMEVSIRDPKDPQKQLPPYREGLLGIIDLANVYSCSFILTGDRGLMDRRGRFQVLGRWNPDDLRGCNFLIDED